MTTQIMNRSIRNRAASIIVCATSVTVVYCVALFNHERRINHPMLHASVGAQWAWAAGAISIVIGAALAAIGAHTNKTQRMVVAGLIMLTVPLVLAGAVAVGSFLGWYLPMWAVAIICIIGSGLANTAYDSHVRK